MKIIGFLLSDKRIKIKDSNLMKNLQDISNNPEVKKVLEVYKKNQENELKNKNSIILLLLVILLKIFYKYAK